MSKGGKKTYLKYTEQMAVHGTQQLGVQSQVLAMSSHKH